MKPAPFRYERAESVEHVVALLGEHGGEAKLLAGGQSLMPMMALHLATPSVLVDLNRVRGLDDVVIDGGQVSIGPLARHRDIEEDVGLAALQPVFREAGSQIGHYPIRVRGTFGGSLAHADPSSEWCVLAALLDAEITATGPDGTRSLGIESFFGGYLTTELAEDELITSVSLRTDLRGRFVEFARRPGDFAMVLAGLAVGEDADGLVREARIVLGGVDSLPVRCHEAESRLLGRRLDEVAAAEAAATAAASVDPPSDIHADGWYRRHLAEVLLRRAGSQLGGHRGRALGDPPRAVPIP